MRGANLQVHVSSCLRGGMADWADEMERDFWVSLVTCSAVKRMQLQCVSVPLFLRRLTAVSHSSALFLLVCC